MDAAVSDAEAKCFDLMQAPLENSGSSASPSGVQYRRDAIRMRNEHWRAVSNRDRHGRSRNGRHVTVDIRQAEPPGPVPGMSSNVSAMNLTRASQPVHASLPQRRLERTPPVEHALHAFISPETEGP
jgi:hypothetical protein